MRQLLQVFTWIPLLSFILSLFLPRRNERIVSSLAVFTAALHLAGIVTFITYWMINNHPILDSKHLVFYKGGGVEIFIDYYFDKITAVFAFVGSFLIFIVTVFSRFYLHREEGFKRYFSTLLLFFLGYNFIIFSGNFETLFIGWEILGICSFLLIAFYRDRYLPVKNGLKVISIYRLSDVCLILAMWMSHHLWHENITFIKFNDATTVTNHLQQHGGYAVFLALMIMIGATAKSAQFPFSSWLPRAMEGPTTSSAIFYGSLSVHLGVFLLLRTWPYWHDILFIKILVITVGLLTSIIATLIARVQSTVKTQIAYSSACQIGLMFIEVALGLHVIALLHFTANAFLRTYQLLVSPSVLNYLIHHMFFHFKSSSSAPAGNTFAEKFKNSLYILSIKEWNLDAILQRSLWDPFKWIGRKLADLTFLPAVILIATLLAGGVVSLLWNLSSSILPVIFSFTGMLLILTSFAHRGNATHSWLLIVAAHLTITISVSLLSPQFGQMQALYYLSGTVISALAGYFCLLKMSRSENDIHLNRFHGYTYEYPRTAFIFLLACLGFAGLPFTPAFIGVDLLFSNIAKNQPVILFIAVSFIFMELSLLRIYSRVFLGHHKKAYHPMAFKYS